MWYAVVKLIEEAQKMSISISIRKVPVKPAPPPEDILTEGGFKALRAEGGCVITDYEGTDEDLVIPDAIEGVKVISTKACMFGTGMISGNTGEYYGNKTAKSITIPACITNIEPGTFIGCHPEAIHVSEDNPNYSSVDGVLFDKQKQLLIRYPYSKKDEHYTVPDGVRAIDVRAFYGCDFTHLTLPDGLERIENEAMHECHDLESIVIPDSVRYIGFNAFCNCYSLKSVTLPSNNTEIDGCAFWQCDLDEIIIPNGIASIGRDAFCGCRNLKSVEIPASVTKLGKYAFPSGTKITFSGEHPTYATKHGVLFNKQKNSLVRFPANSKRKIYKVPKGTVEIESGAFSHCKNLQSIILPDGLTKIGNVAFNMCFSLAEINIPASVTKISKEAFRYCESLASVEFPEGITKIEEGMFNWCKALHTVIIPASVTTIESSAFSWCDSLKNITLPDGVRKIKIHAFCDCKSLTRMEIPNSVTELGAYVFRGCGKLSEISLSNRLTIIANNLFENCAQLKSIEIPSGVKKIYHDAFMGCKNLERVYIPPSVKIIGDGVFSGCVKLKEITGNERFVLDDSVLFNADKTQILQYLRGKKVGYSVPETVTEIQYGAFHNCDKLTEITIPSSVTKLPNFPFRCCTGLANISVDAENPAYASVDGALFNKDKTVLLQYPLGKKQSEYTVPSGVIKTGERSFEGSALERVTLPASIAEIGYGTFFFCKKLKIIDILAPKDRVDTRRYFNDDETQVNYIAGEGENDD
jgi:hypothetical protein